MCVMGEFNGVTDQVDLGLSVNQSEPFDEFGNPLHIFKHLHTCFACVFVNGLYNECFLNIFGAPCKKTYIFHMFSNRFSRNSSFYYIKSNIYRITNRLRDSKWQRGSHPARPDTRPTGPARPDTRPTGRCTTDSDARTSSCIPIGRASPRRSCIGPGRVGSTWQL